MPAAPGPVSGDEGVDPRDAGLGPFVLVTSVDAPELDPAADHHLRRVRRLRGGDPVVAADGAGAWRRCALGDGPALVALGDRIDGPAPHPPVAVAFALVKGEKPELVVQKLTEVGVDRIVPFRAARSVVRWDAPRAAAHHERLARVAREATQQCRRLHLPVVEPVTTFDDVVGREGAAVADVRGRPPTIDHPLVLVGPEGGWSPDERDLAVRHGLPAVALGPHVLRAETAAIVAGAALVAARR